MYKYLKTLECVVLWARNPQASPEGYNNMPSYPQKSFAIVSETQRSGVVYYCGRISQRLLTKISVN